MFIIGRDINDMCYKMNYALHEIEEWLNCNKLSLNVLKTHYMIFTPKNKIIDDVRLLICNTAIQRAYVTKFLGVQTDSKFSWKNHILKSCSCCRKKS